MTSGGFSPPLLPGVDASPSLVLGLYFLRARRWRAALGLLATSRHPAEAVGCEVSASSSRKGGIRMPEATDVSQTVSAGQLRAIIERIERLEEEKKVIADDIKDVYLEAKANGFDTKAIRTIVRLRKKDAAERQEEQAILDLYLAALGMAA